MVKVLGANLGQGSWFARPNVGSSLGTEGAAAARVRSRPSSTAKASTAAEPGNPPGTVN
jgi:hypothetical protein